ncbi:MAG TPA: PD-(D/E)XK nuclease family protein [Candidatus Babeliales bacterium]|nr:PD-(D/E)XK nuclease family protein [Candidatus Babeliales bacterium]
MSGIILTNTDPEADYKALVEKNSNILIKQGLSIEQTIDKHEDGSVKITLVLAHSQSGQYRTSQIVLPKEKNKNPLEQNSPQVFLFRRILHEMLIGVASSNDATEAELFGPKRKHKEISKPYDQTADFIEFEFFDHTGKKFISKQDRRQFERSVYGITSEEEAAATFEVPIRRELSWSDIKIFMDCKRCFFNAKKLGVRRPVIDAEAFAITKGIDSLLKKEFDKFRAQGNAHPVMPDDPILKPLRHKKLKKWQTGWSEQDRKKYGIQFQNVWENCLVSGAVDDIWINDKKELAIVEHKTIAIPVVYPDFSNIQYLKEYKKQVEFYAWILKKNNYAVSSTSYLLFCNAVVNKESFNWNLEFEPHLLAHQIDDSWVQKTIDDALKCLQEDDQPIASAKCKSCKYFSELTMHTKQFASKQSSLRE